MSWLGAGLGAIFGSRGGSILGGVMGAVLGNYLEEATKALFAKDPHTPLSGENKKRELTILAAIAAMLAKMAKVDGRITTDEVRYCERAFNRLGLKGEKREFCIKVFRTAKSDDHSIYDYADSLVAENVDVSVRKIVYDILWDLACSDCELSTSELRILQMIPKHLRLAGSVFDEQCAGRGIRCPAGDVLRDPYAVLGIAATATDEEVRRAYREKAKALHPDRLRAEGLAEELLPRANDEMAAVNAAWSEIRRRRGI